jgi:beta-lactamase regulating signal transducer with metallopeptidase domain
MNGLYYLLEANLYLSILYLFYRLLLKQETFYQLNRWYLIGILLISFSLPFVTVQNIFAEINSTLNCHDASTLPSNMFKEAAYRLPKETVPGRASVIEKVKTAVMLLYGIGVFICIFRLMASIRILTRLFKNSLKYKEGHIIHVRLKGQQDAFSFFNWLFYNPEVQPEKVIISHEMVHIRQKHSIDVLLFELCKAFNWFNPLIYFLCKDVRLNHEFLADQAASKTALNKYAYALLLIGHTEKNPALPLTSAIFRKEQLKQRLLNLKKNRSGNGQLIKYMLALPLLILVFTVTAFTAPKTYGLITFKLPRQQQLSNDQGPVVQLTSHHTPGFHSKISGKALSPDHLQYRSNSSLKKQRKGAKEVLITSAPKERTVGALITVPLNDDSQEGQQLAINRSMVDTTRLLTVKTVYKNGQVSINRSPADTVHQYFVEPVYKDGQVSINKRKVDP